MSRPGTDHVHPDYWTREAHYRFEDRTKEELEKLEKAIDRLTMRVTLMLGGLMLIAFILPVAAPFIRLWLGIQT